MSAYVPAKYITLQDSLEHLGFTVVQINALSKTEKDRYQNWTRQGNNLVESALFEVGNDTPLLETTKEFAYAKTAALDWVVYKKRDKEGSTNAINAEKDHDRGITKLKSYLIALRSTRTKTVSILGKKKTVSQSPIVLLPSQIDTQFS